MSRRLTGLWLAATALTSLSAEDLLGLPLHLQRVDPATLRLWVGDGGRSSAVVAFATQKGLVVVDTLGMPAVDRELRKVIAREFKRNDFKVLINTHEHGDHTLGNEVYADCTIVGHARCGEGMKTQMEALKQWAPQLGEEIRKIEGRLAQAADAGAKKAITEELRFARLNQETYGSARLTLPTQTFQDRHTLKMGDTTFELFFTGGVHSGSDICILVPERGLLVTGDMMADAWCTEVSGCMSSFAVRPGTPHDFPTLFRNWETLQSRQGEVRTYLTGHWNGSLTAKGFTQRAAYIRTLHEGVQASVKAGKPMDQLFREFPLRARFPELVGSPGITPQNHSVTLTGLYAAITGTTSAASRIRELVGAHAPAAEIQRVMADRSRTPAAFYFLEGEFHFHGYQLLQANQPAQARQLFQAWVDAFPQSWNAHDSLGEACMKGGDSSKAVSHYQRSLELNPQNKNAKEMLDKLAAPAKAEGTPRT